MELKLHSIDGKLTTQDTAISKVVSEAIGKAMEEGQHTLNDRPRSMFEEERKRAEGLRPPLNIPINPEGEGS